MIKVSLILPVYNTGKYLRQCLESIENQTLKNFEVLCVDDGSTDDSVEIISEYVKKDSRFHLLEQKCRAGSGPAESLPAGSIPASSEPDLKPAADVLLFLHNSGTSGANRFRTE